MKPWEHNWNGYYNDAEPHAVQQFLLLKENLLADYFDDFDFSNTLDFACGKGRMAELFSSYCERLICCDISFEAIDFCKNRFLPICKSVEEYMKYRSNCKYEFIINTPNEIPLPDNYISLFYSWDAMVHFDLNDFKTTCSEISRILANGGRGFIHHSNLKGISDSYDNPFFQNPHWRSAISAEEVKHILEEVNLKVNKQIKIEWAGINDLDCITIFEK